MTRVLRGAAVLLAGALVLTGCTSQAESDVESGVDRVADEAAATSGEAGAHQHVQDLWVYERVATVDAQGEEVDLTRAVLDGIDGSPDAEVELFDGVTFRVFDQLAPTVTDAHGNERDDLDVVAGLVEYEGEQAVSVLATPETSAPASVRFGDQVFIDLTHLEDRVEPGDPLLFDYAFLQGLPATEEEDVGVQDPLGGLELLAERIRVGQVAYSGEVVDGEPEVHLHTAQVGHAVEGSLRGGMPAKADDMRDGMNKGLRRCKGGIQCVARFFGNFGDGARKSFDRALENGGGTPSPPVTHCRGVNCSQVTGDPHLRTFDGRHYSMHAVGEFVAMTSDDLEVQMRTGPWWDSTTVSVATAAALGFGDHRVTVDREAESEEIVRLDGEPISLDALRAEPQRVGEADVTLVGDALRVEVADRRVTVANLEGRSFLDLYVDLGEEPPATSGLWGNANGDADDDFTTRDGDVLPAPLSGEDLYDTFAPSWRISQEESLFDYAPGTDTEHFTDLTMPEAMVTVDDFDTDVLARAEALCRAAGIENEHALEICMFDYAATGDVDFVRSAAVAEVAQLIRDGELPADADVGAGDDEGETAVGLVSGTYDAGPEDLVWHFTTPEAEPEHVPADVEASAARNPTELPIFQVTDDYGYPTDPVLRVSPPAGARSAEQAIRDGSFVEFEVAPTAGAVDVTEIHVAAGRLARASQTARGLEVRSSADDFGTPLLAAELTVMNPEMERFSAQVSGLRISEPTTFRLYLHTETPAHTIEVGYFVLTLDR